MKKHHRRKSERALFFVLALSVLLFTGSCNKGETAPEPDDVLVFEGTLEKLGPDSGLRSGIVAAYRLAKYRVEKVCEGKYDRKEIVVDHLLFDGKEFDGLSVGDRVCVRTKVSNKVLVRYDAEGIRDPSEAVKTFYEATDKISLAVQSESCCR